MLLLILLFVFSVISRCSAQTTSTVSSTELLTDTETSFRTSTRTTLSHHSVIETDASTVTTGTSKTHTKISTYSSIPTESVTKTSIETSTIDLTEQPSPPPSKTIVTLAPQPSPTCCSWSEGTGPYTRVGSDYAVDTTCLHPRFRTAFGRFINQGMTNKQFCSQSTDEMHDFFQGRVFNMACNFGEDPKGNKKEFEEHKEEYIGCFSGFLQTLCGFHIITHTGFEIDSICGGDW